MSIAYAIIALTGLYLDAGILFGSWFITAGVGKLDANAQNASVGFRALILPGTIALWPVLLVKSIAAARSQT